MGVYFAFRVALYLAPVGYRVISSGQPSAGSLLWDIIKRNTLALQGDTLTDAEWSELLSAQAGYDVSVATWTDEVDLRKLQIRYSRSPAGGTLEDVAVTTHTFLKAPGGVASGAWTDPADYEAVEAAWNEAWGTIKAFYPSFTKLDQYRWYVDNSALRLPDHSPNPALRVTEVDVAGTGSGSALPPQIAVSVTEITAARLSWGRFYLPAMTVGSADTAGRFTYVAQLMEPMLEFYDDCRTAGLVPVVFAPGLPARSSAAARRAAALVGPGTAPAEDIPERAATIYEVTSLQIDDLFDVIRTRRYDRPVVRTRTAVP